MSYRDTIVLLASIVVLGTACSQAPEYVAVPQAESSSKLGTTGNSDNIADAIPRETVAPTEPNEQKPAAPISTEVTMPATPPLAVATDPFAEPNAAQLKAMVKDTTYGVIRGFLLTSKTNGNWGSSIAAPIKIYAAVDAAGVLRNDIPSSFVVCNSGVGYGKATARIHSQANGPFQHGPDIQVKPVDPQIIDLKKTLVAGTPEALPASGCFAHKILRLVATNTATYEHNLTGPSPTSNIYLQVIKVDPNGNIVP